MWKLLNASVIGTSHVGSGTVCQDDNSTDILHDIDNTEYLVCIVADGAGSAVNGGKGAELACVTAISSIEASLQNSATVTEEVVTSWIEKIRTTIFNEAETDELTPRDFACTLVGAVISQTHAIFFQVGDGAIVVTKNSIQGVAFWPDAGQYANMTYFVTDDDAVSHLHTCIVETNIDEVAVMSDGLQRLALVFDKQLPHQPFFEPMFSTLRKQPAEDVDKLQPQLINFLNSSQVNERTDDDKTLILATKLG